ncbi:MAG: DUF2341 domain-containing protein [Promethearchaeota archaeon]
MKSNKFRSINTKKKIEALLFLLFTIIIPMLISTPLFSISPYNDSLNNKDTNDDLKEKLNLNAPLNARYFDHYKSITIDHTQVSGASGLINFPFLISIFDTDLRFDVQSDGDDIAFSSNNVWLDHEIELFDQTYNSTHAKLVVWVRIPVLSVTIDTNLRMYYGNSTMNSRQNPTGVWNSNYVAVWHMNQDPSSSNILDSTSNNYDLTTTGFISDTRIYNGKVGTAISVDGSNDYFYINSINGPINDMAFQTWFKPDNKIDNTTARMDFFQGNTPDVSPEMRFTTSGTVNVYLEVTSDNSEGSYGITDSWAAGSWSQFTYIRDISLSRAYHYINGTLDVTDSSSDNANPHLPWNQFSILAGIGGSNIWGPGAISEFRILRTVLPSGWILTEYNNQYNPNSFYTIGEETSVVWEPPNSQYFSYYKLITIDHNEVSGSGIHNNFPFLFSFVDKDLKYHAQPDGDDIAFAANGDWLDHDILIFNQTYSSTEAQLTVWVQIPNLYSDINTTIAMYYGNSTMSSRENPEGVWDSNYEAVYHFDNDFLDATSHNRDGTNTGSVNVKGKIGNGQDFEHDDSSDNINIGTWSVSGSKITIQAWVKYESFDSIWSGYSDARILSKNSGTSDGSEYHVWMLGTYNQSLTKNGPYFLRGRIKTGVDDAAGTSTVEATSGPLSINTWYLASIRYDGSNINLILDGNNVLTLSKTGPLRENNWPITIGNSPTGDRPIDAIIDEVKISSTTRSNDWLKTEYDNQNDPSTFGSVGGEQIVNDITSNADYFDFYKIITIDHTKVDGTGSHVNFPFLVSIFDKDLHFDVQSDGDDIAFSSDGKWLDHQIESFNQNYNSTHAQLITWVRIPFLSTVEDTEIIMYYGNSTMNSRQNPTGVWLDYKSVWHLNEPSGTGDYIKDSTSNGYDGTPFGTQFSGTSIIDGARYFTGSGDNRILINQGSQFFNGDPTFTFSFWVYPNYATDAEMEATEGRVFYKQSSVRMNRFWRQNWMPAGDARYQSDIQFTTYGTTYNNVGVNRLKWNYITYSYDGTYLKTYVNGSLGPSLNTGGYPLIADTSSFYLGEASNSFKGYLDEFRVLDSYRSDGWVATEYNNQYNPNNFFNIGSEQYSKPIVEVDVSVNALDLYGNLLSNVTISMYQHLDLIEQDITGIDGNVSFTNIIGGAYNFTATIRSNLGDIVEIVNSTSQAIMLDQPFQTVDLICDVSSHFFEVIDVDLNPVESGWIIVGNATQQLQKSIIDPMGHTTFWWVNASPSTYNYTIYYKNPNYNPPIIELASGDITTVNATIQVQVELTTIELIVQTINAPITPVSGAKLKLTLNNPLGPSIVNLTTNIYGKANLRWLTSLEIGGDYSLQIEFFGSNKLFNQTVGGPADVNNISFTVTNQDNLELRILIDLSKFQTELISLNPTDYIEVEWGTLLKLRMLFNVSKVEAGYESLLGPVYADSMRITLLLGGSTVISGAFSKEQNNEGRHFIEIDTTQLDSALRYIIIISAYKSGYTIPSDRILQLNILENEVELNQSNNDDSDTQTYWLESVNMTLNSYGSNSETLTVENLIFQSIDHEFDFLISDIETHWNLSKIVLNLYNISWNVGVSEINITIEDPFGTIYFFNSTTHLGWDYAQGTWTGIILNLNRASLTNDNNFEFLISGTFDNTIDIVADAYFIRDKINVQYSKFNISNQISLLTEGEGWVISNITFEIFDCYDSSDWSVVDLSSLTDLNITTNEGFTYSLDYGYPDGTGLLSIVDSIIYPIGNQFLFTVEAGPNIIFNAIIKVEYIQGFYRHQYLETFNCTKTERGITNGGLFQISAFGSSWSEHEAILWIKSIKSGPTYYFPSEIAMNITIGGQKFSISDYASGIGTLSLSGFSKEQLLHAVIETSLTVDFTLLLSIQYSRLASYEIYGSLIYTIVEAPSVYGSVQYDPDLGYYLKVIDTSLLDADEYTVRFTVNKPHYKMTTKDLNLIVLNRPTLLNQTSDFFRKIESVYVKDAVNFTFVYTDALRGNKISNLKTQYYAWERYDSEGNVIESGNGNIITAIGNTYILDFNTESRALGEYFLIMALEKDNYDRKNAMIILTIKKREINQPILSDNFQNRKTNVVKGTPVPIQIILTDPTKYDSRLRNATITLTIRGNLYNFTEIGNGTYILDFPTYNINAFFTSNTLTGTINITKEDYISQEFDIIIVVEMEQIFPGVPTFYFLLILSAALALVGSIVGYRVVHNARIPAFVRKVREIEKSIKKGKKIDESLLYRSKDAFIVERVNYKWKNLDLSLAEILNLKIEKIKKSEQLQKRSSDIAKVHELKPVGLVLMKWNERIGTEILAKYPEETIISEKTCMQIYSTHEYSGEKGTITLTVGSLNIISYYTGPEQGYYLLLILELEDDSDLYEGGMADVLRNILENVEDDSYKTLIPSYFQRLSLYPSFSDEEILALTYQDDAKRMIIDNLRETGVISKSELDIWFKDKYLEKFVDVEATVSDLLKKGIIKQFSVKGLLSELIALIYDVFMLRVPPLDLIEDPINRGLPTQFKKEYIDLVKKFFRSYIPTNEDNLKIVKLLSNPQVHLTLRLLRSTIVSRQELEKLKVKGVADPYGVVKALWDNQLIAVFQDEMKNEYYALLTDFYIDLIFPKYILQIIKTSYEQKSLTDKVLIEYLETLEDVYYNLKSEEKK